VGIAHIGIGAFHRAHQAAYVDEMLGRSGGDWRIQGISCRSPAVRDQLEPQQGLYTLIERSGEGVAARVIASVAGVTVASEDPRAAVRLLVAPATRLVTLTVTEKGYCRHPASGALDPSHPDIAHDLADPDRPRSPVGLLVAGLRLRRAAGAAPPTVLCCDNLPANGQALARVTREFAACLDVQLADWIEAEVRFPCSMVDRIVPATRSADLDEATSLLGLRDEGVVCTEPFSQWVVEDAFCAGRPPLEQAGVQFVGDVRPFELAKLRLLNGSHSTLAYLGILAGHQFVHEAIADPDLLALVRRLMHAELEPTLPPTPGQPTRDYQQALLARFANPALAHRLAQIAMDGTQKLPQRLLAPLAERLERSEPVDALVLAVAGWMGYVATRCVPGEGATLDDPMAPQIVRAVGNTRGDTAAIVDALLSLGAPFTRSLAAHPGFQQSLVRDLDLLLRIGVKGTLQLKRAGLGWP
jgi:fructuronate reductase